MKKDWYGLTQHQQKVYEQRAAYLIERGYIQDKPIDELAKEMYERDNTK
jgi:hypothetical protein